MPELYDGLPEIEAVLIALNDANVRYVVIGGVAMRLQGAAHRTDDFDVVYSRDAENIAAIVRALRPFRPRLMGARRPIRYQRLIGAFSLHRRFDRYETGSES